MSDLDCSLCCDTFRAPKTLPCLHSFCSECLEIFIERNHSSQKLTCPVCRTPFTLKVNQIPKLKTLPLLESALKAQSSLESLGFGNQNQNIKCQDEENDARYFCIDCEVYLCDFCFKSHKKFPKTMNDNLIPLSETSSEKIVVGLQSKLKVNCETHKQKEIDLFCKQCKIALCSLCISGHKDHQITPLQDEMKSEKKKISEIIKKVEKKVIEIDEKLQKNEEEIQKLELNSITTHTQISKLFKMVQEKLQQRETELLEQLEVHQKAKKKELLLQKESLEFSKEGAMSSCQLITKTLNEGSNAEIFESKKFFVARLNTLQKTISEIPSLQTSLVSFTSQKLEDKIQEKISKLGILITEDISIDQSLILKDDDHSIIYDNMKYSFQIIFNTKDSTRIQYTPLVEIKVFGPQNTTYQPSIIDNKDGSLSVSFLPNLIGKYSINVLYENEHLQSSPFEVQVFDSNQKYPEYSNPNSLCINSKGEIFVTDTGNNKIMKLDAKGHLLSQFGTFGEHNGQFDSPMGIAIGPNDNIYVCDEKNHRIQVFNSNGGFLSKFGTKGEGNGEFSNPYGIAVSSKGIIAVTDNNNHRVQIFSSPGNFRRTFGTKGMDDGQFKFPYGIAIDSNDNIIVSDNNNHRIQVFNLNGTFLFKLGNHGQNVGQLSFPCHISVDQDDRILVADRGNNRIQAFDSDGHVTILSEKNLRSPRAVQVHPKNKSIIVCDSGHNRILIF